MRRGWERTRERRGDTVEWGVNHCWPDTLDCVWSLKGYKYSPMQYNGILNSEIHSIRWWWELFRRRRAILHRTSFQQSPFMLTASPRVLLICTLCRSPHLSLWPCSLEGLEVWTSFHNQVSGSVCSGGNLSGFLRHTHTHTLFEYKSGTETFASLQLTPLTLMI